MDDSSSSDHPDAPPNKRPRLDTPGRAHPPPAARTLAPIASTRINSPLVSLSRSISPPPGPKKTVPVQRPAAMPIGQHGSSVAGQPESSRRDDSCAYLPSSIQLTHIRDLPSAANVDAVSLRDLVCDPLIKELWVFDYLFDIDFLVSALDDDVKNTVEVKVIHGSWRRDDPHLHALEEAKSRYPNVQLTKAYMPEAFGTHHTKMMIMIRHDESAQVVIHTANMIDQDWANLSQAAWRSGFLPKTVEPSLDYSDVKEAARTEGPSPQKLKTRTQREASQSGSTTVDEDATTDDETTDEDDTAASIKDKMSRNSAPKSEASSQPPPKPSQEENLPIGSGNRFKSDLIRYLKAYGNRLTALITQLQDYDFSSIRAALIASVPSRQHLGNLHPQRQTAFGWPGLRQILRSIESRPGSSSAPVVVAQVSSIATLGQRNTWLSRFHDTLSASANTHAHAFNTPHPRKPTFKIVFPTEDEVRASLDGYRAGASIHMKTQSAAQSAQLAYLRPLLHRWGPGTTVGAPPTKNKEVPVREALRQHWGRGADTDTGTNTKALPQKEEVRPRQGQALRQRAAPHVKTYVRFADPAQTRIDWAMVTSANLSTQAWGALENKDGEVRVCSYELGVVVWPGLFVEDGVEGGEAVTAGRGKRKERRDAVMVPVFGRDLPDAGDAVAAGVGMGEKGEEDEKTDVVVGFRMPYDLPLTPYAKEDKPWCATEAHSEPDWKGVVWEL